MSVEWMGDSSDAAVPAEPTNDRPASRRLLVLLAAVACGSGVLGFALGTHADHPSALTTPTSMRGLVILESDIVSAGVPVGPDVCWSDGGDVHAGSPVLVLNSDSTKVVGATVLKQGVMIGQSCELAFDVSVPRDLTEYVVQVGGRPEWGVVPRNHLSDATILIN